MRAPIRYGSRNLVTAIILGACSAIVACMMKIKEICRLHLYTIGEKKTTAKKQSMPDVLQITCKLDPAVCRIRAVESRCLVLLFVPFEQSLQTGVKLKHGGGPSFYFAFLPLPADSEGCSHQLKDPRIGLEC